MFSEEQVRAHLLRVQVAHQRLRILRQTRCEDNELVDFVHALEELGDERSHEHINCADLSIDLHREHDVCILHRFERRVHQCLIEIEH